MMGPRSQKPWQPVLRTSTCTGEALVASSASRRAATSTLPEALQADPEQRVMQGLFGSLCERISFRKSSNSAGEFIRAIVFPYS